MKMAGLKIIRKRIIFHLFAAFAKVDGDQGRFAK